MIRIYNTEVEYDYLFGKGEFCVPDFPLQIEADEQDYMKIIYNFADFSRRREIDHLFMKNFLYLLYNLNLVGDTKKYTKFIQSKGEDQKPGIFLFFKLYDGFKKNRTLDAEVNEFIEDHIFIFREYSMDLPVLVKEYCESPQPILEKIYPLYSLKKENFYKRMMPKNPKTDYAFASVISFINVVNKLQSNRCGQLINFLRASLAYRLGEDNLTSFLTAKTIFTSDRVKNYINETHIPMIFKEDYDNTYEHSLIGRLLHMATTATSFQSSGRTVEIENLLGKILKQDTSNSFDRLYRLVTSGKADALELILSLRENDKTERYKVADIFEVVASCDKKKREEFSNFIASRKLTFTNMRLCDLDKSAAPISFKPQEEDSKMFSIIFSNNYKPIHKCSSYEFYKDISAFQKENMRKYISALAE